MPFQALPIAIRKNTGDPLSKLVLIMLTRACALRDDPYKWPLAYCEPETLARLCQCSPEEVIRSLEHLERMGEIRFPVPHPRGGPDHIFIEVRLPMSDLQPDERKRIKCSPDQINALFERDGLNERGCALCGNPWDEDQPDYHVDHIVPQSRGGADVEENCQVVCKRCNSRKHARLGWVDFLR